LSSPNTPACRRIRGSYKKIADLTSSDGTGSTTDEAGGVEIATSPGGQLGSSRHNWALLNRVPGGNI